MSATRPASGATAEPPAADGAPPAVNVCDRLWRAVEAFESKPALIVHARAGALQPPGSQHTFAFGELGERVRRCAAALSSAGIAPGMRVIVLVRPGVHWFAVTYALFHIGAVPVLIDPGMGRRNLVACLSRVGAQAMVATPIAHAARLLHRRALRDVRTNIVAGRGPGLLGQSLERLMQAAGAAPPMARPAPHAPAAILFTSGSTGPAKGVVYTHAVFDAQARSLAAHFGCGPGDIDLATFPLFALFDVALGMTAVIPDMDATRPGSADPRKIIAAIELNRCTSLFASPALLRRLAAHLLPAGHGLRTLRRVLTAGAPVEPRLLADLRRALAPGAEIHTPYGATEALPVSDIGDREILEETAELSRRGAGTCVGRPLAGLDVRIIAISDAPLPDGSHLRALAAGEVGEIVVRGPVVTAEYHGPPELTRAAKVRDNQGRVWHRMGDVGYLDERGRLWYCGRKSQRVCTADGALFTEPCEAIINQHPAVRRSALVGVGPGEAQPAVCVELTAGGRRADRRALLAELAALAQRAPATRSICTFFVYPREFPVDVRHNAKIRREELAAWAARQRR
ncbi:MAG: AMP-binding protein [Phycisphaerae bacterium]|nr:AMP-binding protein [Phycisphaerae bacterium]MCZ2399077.1 AMP-binding protein [Phycisphaerae bacterium]